MGGFMPTPAAPAQPPQVKLDTTADSRGNFNNFLKNMNGATLVNPPVVAPAMGAMTPNMAPALSNIDIFNQPIQMMQEGGVADFGDFFDEVTSVADDDRSDLSDDNIDTSSPDSDMDYTDVFSSDELQQATDIGRQTGGDDTPSVPNVTFNNQTILNATRNLPEGSEAQRVFKKDTIATLQDYAKDNDLAGALNQFQIAAIDGDKRGENIVNSIIQASNVNPAAYSRAVFNQPTASDILGTGEKNVMDAVDLTKPVADAFDMTPFDVRGVPAYTDQIMRGTVDPGITPTDTSRPFVSFDVGNQARDIQRALEQGTLAENLDKPERPDQLGLIPDSQSELDQAPSSFGRIGFASSIDPRDDELETTDPFVSFDVKPGVVEKALSGGLGTSGLTETDIKNIQDAADRDLIARSVEDKSRIFEPSTNIGGVNIPNFLGRGLNKLAEITDQRVMRGITERGLIPVVDRDGTITGAKDRFGNLIEGMDFSIQDRATSDNEPTPIIRPLTPKPEEPKPDLPPNVIGGTGGQLGSLQPVTADTVVASPFAPASSNIRPVTFDSGDLNKLIEQLLGAQARPVVSAQKGGVIGMANGGLIKAVDDFLAAS